MIVSSIISKVAPALGGALAGPAGGFVGSLISSVLGVDMSKPDEVEKKIQEDPDCVVKLKELELQLADLQSARAEASKETGYLRLIRPFLAIAAMMAIFIDIVLIKYIVDDDIVKQILIVMMVCLVWDVRQIYKFYFGSDSDVPRFLFRKRNN